MPDRQPTIAVLYPGELGAGLGALLKSRGARVVTTVAGRGERTVGRCRDAGIVVLDSLADVARESDFVISLVPPAAAEEQAAHYLATAARPGALYIDCNSVGPQLARLLAARFTAAGRAFVDAAINGLAKNLTTSATLFLSGARAADVEQLVSDAMRVRNLGPEPGRASAMKMLLAGLSKGICALYLELAMVARHDGMLGEMIEACTLIYPGVAALADRMLPTYAQHASRRATEMSELESTVRAAGVEPCVTGAVRNLHESLAAEKFDADVSTVNALVERLATSGFLKK